jgi:SAM-dependent methyltransferase
MMRFKWRGCLILEIGASASGEKKSCRRRPLNRRAYSRCHDDEMNRLHRWYCRSGRWKQKLEAEILPWSLKGVELGDDVLEIGPGPGLTTDWLQHRCTRLTCLEVDRGLAGGLERRTAASRICVQCGDATAMPYPDCSFSNVVSFSVLHHVPSAALQNRLFAEAYRVLRPGGTFAGVDSTPSLLMRIFHIGDTMVLVDPAGLPVRLESVGFRETQTEIGTGRFRFFARRPLTASAERNR